ncbi:hypothetical protein ABRY94_11630 [Castellaniella ginsengisoli]|uniref:XRE family transcriptional regulator n=1 Tax=Castellaniella ginsengisoli TaxID=546114 RepID=A0AB39ESH1_9BURK
MTQHATPHAGHHRPMNGATLKTIREALGLSVPWFANFCSVQERTVRHWESGRNTVPILVATAIRKFEKAAAELSAQVIDQARAAVAKCGPSMTSFPVIRYASDEELNLYQPNMSGLPATFHSAAIARARWAMASEIEIVATMLNAGAYEVWCRRLGQPVSPGSHVQFPMAWKAMEETERAEIIEQLKIAAQAAADEEGRIHAQLLRMDRQGWLKTPEMAPVYQDTAKKLEKAAEKRKNAIRFYGMAGGQEAITVSQKILDESKP